MPVFVEVTDPASGAFNGILVALAAVMLGTSMVAIGVLMSNGGIAESLHENLLPALIGGLAVAGAGAVIGFMMSKSAAAKQALSHRA
jgi:hypothetical protein